MRKLGWIVLLVAAQGLAGCGDSGSPSTPSAVAQAGSTPPSLPTPSVSRIWGYVLDTAFRPVADATVDVVDGPYGGLSATTDVAGRFELAGTFDQTTRFRAAKEGHIAATQAWNCSSSGPCGAGGATPWLGFYLAVIEPNVDIAGDYTLTVIADSACATLPDEVRTRTYAARITPQSRPDLPANAGFDVRLSPTPRRDGEAGAGSLTAGSTVPRRWGGHGHAGRVTTTLRRLVEAPWDRAPGAGPGNGRLRGLQLGTAARWGPRPTRRARCRPGEASVIRGIVYDTALRPLDGARVEVLDGPQAGTSTTSNAEGGFCAGRDVRRHDPLPCDDGQATSPQTATLRPCARL